MKKNIPLLYGFSFFDQFMIVIALWVPYLATQGISMRQFMELQAVFAVVILCGEVPSGLLSDLWGRKKTLLLGSTLKAVSFSLLPLWSSYEGFLVYHLTMGIALSMISGGDVALLYDSYLAAGGEKSRGTAVLGNAKLAAQIGDDGERAAGGRGRHPVLWASAVGQRDAELDPGAPRAAPHRAARGPGPGEEVGRSAQGGPLRPRWYGTPRRGSCSSIWSLSGTGGLVMFWVNQKYWQESGVPLAWFGVLLAGYSLTLGFAGRSAALAGDEIRPATVARRGRRACPSSRISGWRRSSVGAGSCSGSWARSAGAWAGCSFWTRSTRGSPPRSARP